MTNTASTYLLAATILSSAAVAQTHDRDDLVQGQLVEFRFDGLPLSSVGVALFSPAGVGTPFCIPAPWSVCLDLVPPYVPGPQLPSDAAGYASFELLVPADSSLLQMASQGLWMDLSTPVVGLTSTNSVDGFVETLAAYNEAFDGDRISDIWQSRMPGVLTHQLSGALLEISINAGGPGFQWRDDDEGPGLMRTLRGDFTVTADAMAFDPTNTTAHPQITHQFAGLVIRDPRSAPGARNWGLIAVGGGDAATPRAVTAISTLNSVSTFHHHDQTPEPTPLQAEVRILRIGDRVELHHRNVGSIGFSQFVIMSIPGLPDEVEIGMIVSSESVQPGVIGGFASISYE